MLTLPKPLPGQILGDDYGNPETSEVAQMGGEQETWKYWGDMIKAAFKAEERWREEGVRAEELAFGKSDIPFHQRVKGKSDVDLIYANIETLKPLVYATPPEPIVRRRFGGDGKDDPVARSASEIVQRLCQFHIDTTSYDKCMESARDAWLVPGRGTCRVLYRAHIEEKQIPVIDGATGMQTIQEVMEKVAEWIEPKVWAWPRVVLDPASSWEDMNWLAYETPMTKKEVAGKFPGLEDEMTYPISGLRHAADATGGDDAEIWATTQERSHERVVGTHDQCIVFEIWDKSDRTLKYWSPHYTEGLLSEEPDPLGLEGFFDMPPPLLANRKGSTMDVRPDIAFYANRAEEVNVASKKMRSLLEAVSASGIYPGEMEAELKKLLSGESRLIPVENWMAMIQSNGSMKELIQWLPMDALIQAASALQSMVELSKQQMYEVSGVSDIVRGQGEAEETATAQKIKGRYAGLRLQVRQRTMGEFARNVLRIMCEIAVEHFDTQTIADITSLDLPLTEQERLQNLAVHEAAAHWDQVSQMGQQMPMPRPEPHPEWQEDDPSFEVVHAALKKDLMRKYMINIETDSTIVVDEESDKKARIEFLTAFTTFVSEIGPLASSGVFDFRIAKELLLFGVRGFRSARTLESMISSLPDEIDQQPPEDTAVTVAKIRSETDLEIAKLKAEVDIKEHTDEMEFKNKSKGADLMVEGAKAEDEARRHKEDRQQHAQGAN